MAKRDSRTIRVNENFIKVLDSLASKFEKEYGVELSYADISKIISKKLEGRSTITSKGIINFSGDDIVIDLITEEICVDKKTDAEHYATGYFKELGWKVYFSKKLNSEERELRKNYYGGYSPKLVEIVSLYEKYPKLEECIRDSLGIPDLVMFKDDKYMFVEVKTDSDGLRVDQLIWMKTHNNVDIIVFHLKQEILKNEKRNNNN